MYKRQLVIVISIILWKTQLGYKIRLSGDNTDAARYAGVNIRKLTIIVFSSLNKKSFVKLIL